MTDNETELGSEEQTGAPAPDERSDIKKYNEWAARNNRPLIAVEEDPTAGMGEALVTDDDDLLFMGSTEIHNEVPQSTQADGDEQDGQQDEDDFATGESLLAHWAARDAKERADAKAKAKAKAKTKSLTAQLVATQQPKQPKPQPQPTNKEGHDQTCDRDDQADDAVWSNPWSKMGQAKQAKALRELHRMRMKAGKVDKPFLAWAADMKVDLTRVYDTDVLGKKVAFSVPEDEVFCSTRWCKPVIQMRKGSRVTLTAMAFPAMVPAGETKYECRRRREKFRRRQTRDAMQAQPQLQLQDAKPASRVTRLRSLINVLPLPPGRITIAAAAAKLRPHRSWRMPDGKMLMLASIERDIRRMCEHPDIGCEVRHDPNGHALPTRLLWRKPNGPRG